MSGIDDLPPDQRAALQLLLGQNRTYDELAGMLRIDREAVRRRAVSALEALGPRDGELPPPERRAEITDWLLGQSAASEREAVREYLAGSAPARAWTRVVTGELRPLAGPALPSLPPERPAAIPGTPTGRPGAGADAETGRPRPGRDLPPVISPAGEGGGPKRSSRVGGAVLLVGVAILIAAAILIALNVGGGGGGGSVSTGNTQVATNPPTGTTSTTAQPRVAAQVNLLTPGPRPSNKRLGVAYMLTLKGQWVLEMAAQGLAPSTKRKAYGVWLTGGTGKNPQVFLGYPQTPVGQNGQLRFQYALTLDPTTYTRLLLTREPDNGPNTPLPKQPGEIVLSGAITKPKR